MIRLLFCTYVMHFYLLMLPSFIDANIRATLMGLPAISRISTMYHVCHVAGRAAKWIETQAM